MHADTSIRQPSTQAVKSIAWVDSMHCAFDVLDFIGVHRRLTFFDFDAGTDATSPRQFTFFPCRDMDGLILISHNTRATIAAFVCRCRSHRGGIVISATRIPPTSKNINKIKYLN